MTSRRRRTEQRRFLLVAISTVSLIAILVVLIVALVSGNGEKDITPSSTSLRKSLSLCLDDKDEGETCVVEYTFRKKGEKAEVEVLRVTE